MLTFGAAGLVMWLWWQGGRDLTEVVQETSPPAPRRAAAPAPLLTNPPNAALLVTGLVTAPRIAVHPPPSTVVTNPPPAAVAVTNAAPPPPADLMDVLALQIGLARRGISSGPLDGVFGGQTRTALRTFQQAAGLPTTGHPDAETRRRLSPEPPLLTRHVVTADEMQRLKPVPATWLGKSQASRLDYETLLELIAERAGTSPTLVLRLNPKLDWAYAGPGTGVTVPAASLPSPRGRAALLRISLAEKTLQAWDASSNLLFHAPCSIARKVEKRPVGRLAVTRFALGPEYLFNPAIFPESPEARAIGRKLTLPPGPNNPVGTAWISLDRPGYGIHGTPLPEQVGRTESHGCFRLANWNAEHLVKLVWAGLPVLVEP
ncbi:MAG: L,D-transpeptidase [Limisphaerales bacterium]